MSPAQDVSPRAVAAACAQERAPGDKAGGPPAGAVVARVYKLKAVGRRARKNTQLFHCFESKCSSISRRAAARAKATVGRNESDTIKSRETIN